MFERQCIKNQSMSINIQFLYHVTLVVIFQVKSWPDSTFCFFESWELVANLLKNNLGFYPLINNTKFSQVSADSSDSQSKANPRNWRKFLILEDFSCFFIEVLRTALIYQITNNECLRGNQPHFPRNSNKGLLSPK